MTSPEWIGPLYVYNVTYNSAGPYVDYYFICRVGYATSATDDGARFIVELTFDSQLTSITKTTTSSSLDVVFTAQDINSGFDKEVWPKFVYRVQKKKTMHLEQNVPICVILKRKNMCL